MERLFRKGSAVKQISLKVDSCRNVMMSTRDIDGDIVTQWAGKYADLNEAIRMMLPNVSIGYDDLCKVMRDTFATDTLSDLHMAGICYMGADDGDDVPAMWPFNGSVWSPVDCKRKARILFTMCAEMATGNAKNTFTIFANHCRECDK